MGDSWGGDSLTGQLRCPKLLALFRVRKKGSEEMALRKN